MRGTAAVLILAGACAGPMTMAAECPAEARVLLDRARSVHGELEAEMRLYAEAARIAPSCAEAHNGQGDVLERQGRLEEALAAYSKAAALDPRFATARFGMGDVLVKLGRRGEALDAYRQGLARDPSDVSARARVSELEGAGGVIPADQIRRSLLGPTRGMGARPAVRFGENLIPFDLDSARIRTDARPQLDEIGRALSGLSASDSRDLRVVDVILVVGHTDSRGDTEYNRRLSEERARAVVDYLVRTAGVPAGLLEPLGRGEADLLCRDETEGCHAQNRRVEVQREKR